MQFVLTVQRKERSEERKFDQGSVKRQVMYKCKM